MPLFTFGQQSLVWYLGLLHPNGKPNLNASFFTLAWQSLVWYLALCHTKGIPNLSAFIYFWTTNINVVFKPLPYQWNTKCECFFLRLDNNHYCSMYYVGILYTNKIPYLNDSFYFGQQSLVWYLSLLHSP